MTAEILSLEPLAQVEPAPAEQPPARMVAGALAHLARHMETGCQRSAYLAAMLLEQVANDPEADAHLRRHASELVDILDRDDAPVAVGAEPAPHGTSAVRPAIVASGHPQLMERQRHDCSTLSGVFMGTF